MNGFTPRPDSAPNHALQGEVPVSVARFKASIPSSTNLNSINTATTLTDPHPEHGSRHASAAQFP